MAGDWIKIEHALPDKPECIRLAARLEIDQDAVVGKLVRLWIWADQQTLDGNAPVTPAFIDRLTNCPGFAAAIVDIGWLRDRNGTLQLPRFDRHNGQTAKRRALAKDRMKRSRDVANVTGPSPEKRREEKSNGGSGSDGGGLKNIDLKALGDPVMQAEVDRFLVAWNASEHTRKVDYFGLPPHLVYARFTNPSWIEHWPKALAKLPLKAFAADPVMHIDWFLEEQTVGRILSGKWDFEPRNKGQAKANSQATVSEALNTWGKQ